MLSTPCHDQHKGRQTQPAESYGTGLLLTHGDQSWSSLDKAVFIAEQLQQRASSMQQQQVIQIVHKDLAHAHAFAKREA